RCDRTAVRRVVAQRVLEVLYGSLVVAVTDARDLAEPEEQIGCVAALRVELERLAQRLLALLPVAATLVDLRQPGERGDRAGLALQDLLEDLAGGVGVVELGFPYVSCTRERLQLGVDVTD